VRVGIDGRKIPRAREYGPLRSLNHAVELGMEGIFFRTVLEMSPTLDPAELGAIRARADELGLYLEAGLGKVNPYASAEAPELRAIGDGDTRLGFERMMRACAAIDCRELWIGTANFKPQFPTPYCYDRFRTDAPWADQLAATEKFLKLLAPVARDLGIHMNLETHEEITSWEVVRLVEAVGPDVMGVTLDVGQMIHRGESAVRAAERVAPYVRQTHIKDISVHRSPERVPGGIARQVRPIGEGIVDFEAIVGLLLAHRPETNLSIEHPSTRAAGTIPIDDPRWLESHPDLTRAELDEVLVLAAECERRFASGELLPPDAYAALPWEYEDEIQYIRDGAAYLRAVVRKGLTGTTKSTKEPRTPRNEGTKGGGGPTRRR
jgi:sugar phosphate isomerase/epimerase